MPHHSLRSLWIFICYVALAFGPLAFAEDRMEDGVSFTYLRPSATDSTLKDFDDPHWIYAQRDIVVSHDPKLPADRHELLLWIPGTKPPTSAPPEPGRISRGASHAFCLTAASLGYHVIALSYPNSLSASSCNNDSEPAAFEDFRMAIIAGGTTKHITVTRTDSIENRLILLLRSLTTKRPAEDWGQFLNADGSIRWERIAVAGQSQGGAHAALIGIHHHVTRVLCFGAPKDYSVALHAPAAWYSKPSATPKDVFFAFNHQQDRQGCTPENQIENLRALKLDQFGQPFVVDGAVPPYQHAHILMTNYPGTKVDSQTAHGTMISPANKQLFAEAWKYMLTSDGAAK
jgi:pimeloyl-ACP methyl ester carboxylesterase